MTMKPVFCSECGAKLTGSATFCSACGAKQEFASEVVVQTPAPVVEPVVETVPAVEPVVEAAPVAQIPAAAPENSLAAPKARISVAGLILAIAAVLVTFGTELIQMYDMATLVNYGRFSFEALAAYLRNPTFSIGLLTAWVVPLVAVVMVLIKKKPAALVGIILAVLSLVAQILLAAAYTRLLKGRVPVIFRVLPIPANAILNMVNGEALFDTLQRMAGYKIFWSAFGLQRVLPMLAYYLKNILAMAACLLAVVKKQK